MSIRLFSAQAYDAFNYTSAKRAINFSYGLPDPATFAHLIWPSPVAELIDDEARDIFQYTDSCGYPPLRQCIAKHYGVSNAEVCVTNGASQAMQLIADVLLNPGDIVLMENPSYLGARRIFSIAGARLIDINMDDDGVDIDALKRVLVTEKRIKFFYTMPAFHNPTGRATSVGRGLAISQLLQRFGVAIVQDLVYSALPYTESHCHHVYSRSESISIHSGSKIFGPGLRVGWMIAPSSFIEKVALLKCDGGVSPVVSSMASKLLASNEATQHLVYLKNFYRQKRDEMYMTLRSCEFCDQDFYIPMGGFSFWVRLCNIIDPDRFIESVKMEYKIELSSGAKYGTRTEQYVRLCFSFLSIDKARTGLQALDHAYRKDYRHVTQ